MSNGSIFIVEDQAIVAKDLADSLESLGYYVPGTARTGQEAIRDIAATQPELVLMDIRLKGNIDGIEVAAHIRENFGIPVVYLTAYSDDETLERAKETEPLGYLLKPFEERQLYTTVEMALNQQRVNSEALKKHFSSSPLVNGKENIQLSHPEAFQGVIAESNVMIELFEKIELVSKTDVSVHVYGENGTGKELIADIVHRLSPRAKKNFVKLNCSAIPATLLESALFGHVKGSFTGASKDQQGFIEHAEGGTIFLDEIGDIAPEIQIKLLRLLQNREYSRVGETKIRNANIRIVTATNRVLQKLVEEGKIREDFFYRINVFPVTVPALRDRPTDIALLAEHFRKLFNKQFGKSVTSISEEVSQLFLEHKWPGNVRELENVLRHAFVLVNGSVLESKHLPSEFKVALESPTSHSFNHCNACEEEKDQQGEQELIQEALRKTSGNKTKAAELLGYSRVTLWKRLKQYGLD